MAKITAAVKQQAHDRDGIGHVQQHDTRRHHAIERRITPQIKTAQHHHDPTTHGMRPQRHMDPPIHPAQEPTKGQPLIPGEAPAEAGLPRMARDEAPDARGHEEGLEDDGAGRAVQGLVEEGEDGDEGGGGREVGEVGHAEEEGDAVGPGGEEAGGDGAHDGDGDLAFGVVDFFGKVGGAVEACEGVVCVYEADDECWEGVSLGGSRGGGEGVGSGGAAAKERLWVDTKKGSMSVSARDIYPRN